MNRIKNIIFDLGEVIIDVDPMKTVKEFERLGSKNIHDIFHDPARHGVFHRFETGDIDEFGFCDSVRELLAIQTDDEMIASAWNAMLGEIPEERLTLLRRLKNDYSIFLFSNTNVIHLNAVNAYLGKAYGISSLADYFDKEYYSFQLRKRKPDPLAFGVILKENNLSAGETLFLDDVQENLDGAASLGIRCSRVTRENGILTQLQEF